MDRDPSAAFRRVEELLFGGPSRPGLTLYDLQRLVGYPAKGKEPYVHTLPALPGVQAVRLYYYPEDPELELIVEIVDREGKQHLRHFRWNGVTWETPKGKKGELKATAVPQGPLKVGEDYFLGFAPEEAVALEAALRRGRPRGSSTSSAPGAAPGSFTPTPQTPRGSPAPPAATPPSSSRPSPGRSGRTPRGPGGGAEAAQARSGGASGLPQAQAGSLRPPHGGPGAPARRFLRKLL